MKSEAGGGECFNANTGKQPRIYVETLSLNTETAEWSPYFYRVREETTNPLSFGSDIITILKIKIRCLSYFNKLILSKSGNVMLSRLLPRPQLFQDDVDSQVSRTETWSFTGRTWPNTQLHKTSPVYKHGQNKLR